MSFLTSTQTLMRYLTKSSEWYVDSKKKEYNAKLQFLFFTSKFMQKLLCLNIKILIMNCIYKTNKYKISLLIIIEVIVLNIIFYVDFCFMKKKSYSDYEWIIKTLVRLYDYLDLFYSTIIIFDNDRALLSTLSHVFFEHEHRVNHLLCIWHINQNVTVNCKKYFSTNKKWKIFYKRWKNVVYANISKLLEKR